MNRADFIELYAQRNHITKKKATEACAAVFDLMAEIIAEMGLEDRFYIYGLGTFKRKKLAARTVEYFGTDYTMELPESSKVIFIPSAE